MMSKISNEFQLGNGKPCVSAIFDIYIDLMSPLIPMQGHITSNIMVYNSNDISVESKLFPYPRHQMMKTNGSQFASFLLDLFLRYK